MFDTMFSGYLRHGDRSIHISDRLVDSWSHAAGVYEGYRLLRQTELVEIAGTFGTSLLLDETVKNSSGREFYLKMRRCKTVVY